MSGANNDNNDTSKISENAKKAGGVPSPYDKHFEERARDQLFAFAERPSRAETDPPPPSLTGSVNGSDLKRINGILSIILILIVAVAPIPVGSNRPVFWLLWAAIIFAVFGIYLVVVSKRGFKLRSPVGQVPLISAAAVLFVAYAWVQTLPISATLPAGLLSQTDSVGQQMISLSRDATRVASLRWASYAIFFFMMLQVVENRTRARRLAWAIFLIITLHATIGLISFRFLGEDFFWGPKSAYLGVVTGTFVNRNSFATFTGFGAILGAALLLHDFLRGGAPQRLGWVFSIDGIRTATLWICLSLILAALVATGSRMGVAATGVAILLVGFLTVRKHAQKSGRSVLVLVAGQMGALILLFMVFGKTVLNRAIFSSADSESRLDLYAQTIDLIQSRPLTGFGLDAFELAFEQVHRPPVSPDLIWGRAHSTYLTHWTEMGVLFGSLPLLICALIAVRMVQNYRRQTNDTVLAIAGLGVLTLAGLHSLVDFSLEMSANVFLFLALLALAFPSRRRSDADPVAEDVQP